MCLIRYECSKLSQQRLMRQGGPESDSMNFLWTLSHWHSQKKQMNLVRALRTTIQSVVSRLLLLRETCTNGDGKTISMIPLIISVFGEFCSPDSVTGTATKGRWILSKYLPCLHSFQARPDAESFKILLNNFVPCQPKNLCMSINLYKYWMCTHVANWPSRGLCDKVGPESHIMNALPRF